MPQPAPAPAPIPVPALEPTYAKGVQPIMAAYCVGCHSAAGGTSPYLDTLARVKANYANIMSQVDTGGMPLPSTPTSALPTDKINILADWGTSPNTPYGQFAP